MTEKVSWRAQMALGYAPIDEEHEAFIPVVNEALQVLENKDLVGAEDIFDKCYAFARTHFSHEEALMEKLDYPDIMAHMKSHQIFIKNVSELRQLYEFAPEDEKMEVFKQLADFLNVWFIGHVLSRDSLLKPFLKSLPPES